MRRCVTLLGPAISSGIIASLISLGGCDASSSSEGNGTASHSNTVRPAEPQQARPAEFDIDALPVSNQPLGEFPYFTLPDGYVVEEKGEPGVKAFARFPFWTGRTVHWVEGEMYQAGFVAAKEKPFSIFEVVKNFDMAIAQIGGAKVSEAQVPAEIREQWGSEIKNGFYYPFFQSISNPTHVWAVHRNDGNIWVMLAGGSALGGYVIAREAPLAQTTRLIPAAKLKQTIVTDGKVAISVNFATDETTILPDSVPQMKQVLQLLNDDPRLKLSVEGHTDETGSADHNQQLSEGRAKSVVTWLVARGVPAGKLTARGYGSSRPVAGNDTEQGKFRNRRVELVRQ